MVKVETDAVLHLLLHQGVYIFTNFQLFILKGGGNCVASMGPSTPTPPTQDPTFPSGSVYTHSHATRDYTVSLFQEHSVHLNV